MTYFSVLLTYVVPPLLLLAIWVPRDAWHWVLKRGSQPDLLPYKIVLLHVLIALVYTTPWDNYLVATGVWWYDPSLVTGIRLGYVPIEEYTFFVLMTLLTGLWTIWLLRRFPAQPLHASFKLRLLSAVTTGLLWVTALALWLSGWRPGVYLSLILTWALLPILGQLIFGADILWARRKALALGVVLPTLYLWLVDGLAIGSGTWVIDPQQTTGLMIGVLPVEEMLFFFATNVILALGVALMVAPESHARAALLFKKFKKEPG